VYAENQAVRWVADLAGLPAEAGGTLSVTRAGADLIRDAEHVRLLVEPDLTALLFERVGWATRTTPAGARLLDEQIAFVTATRHAERVCTRFAIVNPLTTADDLALIIDSMR
jgi:L-2,4-diaminobutyrate decarboxylase